MNVPAGGLAGAVGVAGPAFLGFTIKYQVVALFEQQQQQKTKIRMNFDNSRGAVIILGVFIAILLTQFIVCNGILARWNRQVFI